MDIFIGWFGELLNRQDKVIDCATLDHTPLSRGVFLLRLVRLAWLRFHGVLREFVHHSLIFAPVSSMSCWGENVTVLLNLHHDLLELSLTHILILVQLEVLTVDFEEGQRLLVLDFVGVQWYA